MASFTCRLFFFPTDSNGILLNDTKGAIGTGLGLWVSKQIIDKHGGTIRMHSSSNGAHRGTVFSVVLPVEPAAATRSQSAGA